MYRWCTLITTVVIVGCSNSLNDEFDTQKSSVNWEHRHSILDGSGIDLSSYMRILEFGRPDEFVAQLRIDGIRASQLSSQQTSMILASYLRYASSNDAKSLYEFLDLGVSTIPSGEWQSVNEATLTGTFVLFGNRDGEFLNRLVRVASADPRLGEPDRYGWKAVDYAIADGQWEACILLQALGSAPPDWNRMNIGVAYRAVLDRDWNALVRVLEQPFDANAELPMGGSAIELARHFKYQELVELLENARDETVLLPVQKP